jgi:glutamyl-tRNA reductase
MNTPGTVSSVRVSHEYATVEEIASAGAGSQREQVAALLERPDVQEAFALQTCNRAEAYVVTDTTAAGQAALDDFAPSAREAAVVRSGHEESLRHLMRVATGLDSLVLGEDQILGQLRTAYEDARAVGGIGTVLEEGITKAIHVGERARAETGINEGTVSIGSAAVDMVAEELALEDTTALVVGAGQMGTIAARHFDDTGVERLLVANRTVPHAEHLAEEVSVPAEALGLDDIEAAIDRADAVVSATGSDGTVVEPSAFEATEAFVVDIAQPRDVPQSVAAHDGVAVTDLDRLEAVTDETMARRREAAEAVEGIIDREFANLIEQFKRRRADEAIAAMHENAERLKDHEVQTALSRLEAAGDLTDQQRQVVESLADSLVGKLLAAPTSSLRDAAAEDDWETIRTALELFDPGFDDGPPTDAMPERASTDTVEDD